MQTIRWTTQDPPEPVELLNQVHTRKTTKATQDPSWVGQGPLSLSNIGQKQKEDPILSDIYHWLEHNSRPSFEDISMEDPVMKIYWTQWSSLSLQNGVIWRIIPMDEKRNRKQVLVPSGLQEEVLKMTHDSITAGHFGLRKTLGVTRTRFFWPCMKRDIRDWILCCHTCAKRKGTQKARQGPMKTYGAGSPMERVAMDILGPLPESTKGNKYNLVISDYFTRWAEAYALPNQEAQTVAEVVVTEFFS